MDEEKAVIDAEKTVINYNGVSISLQALLDLVIIGNHGVHEPLRLAVAGIAGGQDDKVRSAR